MENRKLLVGIDAGFVATGISIFDVTKGCIFVTANCIRTEKSLKKRSIRVADDDSERVKNIIIGLDEMIKKYNKNGNKFFVAVELPTGGAQGARPNRTMGIITGAIVAFTTLRNLPVEWVTPAEVKVAVSGNKSASKDEIMDKIRRMLSNYSDELPKAKKHFEHIADSVGVVLHTRKHSQMYKFFINN